MFRTLLFAYGVACYLLTLGTLTFLAVAIVDFSAVTPAATAGQKPFESAVLTNLALLTLFALQHSVMARPGFKRWWTRVVPAPIERSTYLLATCLTLLFLFWQWQPLGIIVWNVEAPAGRAALYGLYAAGWLGLVAVTFLLNHFDLFGLRQVWAFYRRLPYRPLPFRTPGAYRFVRHPLYITWFVIFWATPTMTLSHLMFAIGTTAYIFIAIPFEERDLVAHLGQAYAQYRRRIPMLIPRLPKLRQPSGIQTVDRNHQNSGVSRL